MDNTQKKELFLQAWKEVLGVKEAGDNDNFFEVGGDSVKGVQLVAWLAQKGLKLDMLKLYTEPTVSQLINELEETQPIAVPAEMLTKENFSSFIQDPVAQKMMQQAAANGQIPMNVASQQQPIPQQPMYAAQQQSVPFFAPRQPSPAPMLLTPMPQMPTFPMPFYPSMPQMPTFPAQLCTPQYRQPMFAGPQYLLPMYGVSQQPAQLCTPQQPMFGTTQQPAQLCTPPFQQPMYAAPQQPTQLCTPQQQMPQPQMQLCTPEQQMPQPQMQLCTPEQQTPQPQMQLCTPEQQMPQPPMQLCTPEQQMPQPPMQQMPSAPQGSGLPFMGMTVNAPIENPVTMKINEPRLGPVTKSPEDALDTVLRSIFLNGYDKQANLFEQGLDSLKIMQIVTRCGEQGYRVNMQDIMKDPTFKGIVACMKTE